MRAPSRSHSKISSRNMTPSTDNRRCSGLNRSSHPEPRKAKGATGAVLGRHPRHDRTDRIRNGPSSPPIFSDMCAIMATALSSASSKDSNGSGSAMMRRGGARAAGVDVSASQGDATKPFRLDRQRCAPRRRRRPRADGREFLSGSGLRIRRSANGPRGRAARNKPSAPRFPGGHSP